MQIFVSASLIYLLLFRALVAVVVVVVGALVAVVMVVGALVAVEGALVAVVVVVVVHQMIALSMLLLNKFTQDKRVYSVMNEIR